MLNNALKHSTVLNAEEKKMNKSKVNKYKHVYQHILIYNFPQNLALALHKSQTFYLQLLHACSTTLTL